MKKTDVPGLVGTSLPLPQAFLGGVLKPASEVPKEMGGVFERFFGLASLFGANGRIVHRTEWKRSFFILSMVALDSKLLLESTVMERSLALAAPIQSVRCWWAIKTLRPVASPNQAKEGPYHMICNVSMAFFVTSGFASGIL